MPKKPINPKKPKKEKTKKVQKPVSNFECWPNLRAKPKKQKTQKTKKNEFSISNSGQNQCQKNQKKTKNQCQFGNFKKHKKSMPIYRFWCSDWFFLGEHPPPPNFHINDKFQCMVKFSLIKCFSRIVILSYERLEVTDFCHNDLGSYPTQYNHRNMR